MPGCRHSACVRSIRRAIASPAACGSSAIFIAGDVSGAPAVLHEAVDQGRSRVMRRNCGLLRLYGESGTKRFLGAEMVGPRAEHLAHLLAWACQSGMTVGQMLKMPFYHPVIEEGLRTALRDLQEKLTDHVSEAAHCADCTPGM